MKKEKLIEVLKSIFENAKRIHGNSDSVDYVEVAIYRAATYLSKEDKFDEHYKRDDEFIESYLSKEQEVEGVKTYPYLTRYEVARKFNISHVTLTKWCKEGIIQFHKVGHRILFDKKYIAQLSYEKYRHPVKLYVQQSEITDEMIEKYAYSNCATPDGNGGVDFDRLKYEYFIAGAKAMRGNLIKP